MPCLFLGSHEISAPGTVFKAKCTERNVSNAVYEYRYYRFAYDAAESNLERVCVKFRLLWCRIDRRKHCGAVGCSSFIA